MSLYAATPPTEALRLILHQAATNRQNEQFKIMTNVALTPFLENFVEFKREKIRPGF